MTTDYKEEGEKINYRMQHKKGWQDDMKTLAKSIKTKRLKALCIFVYTYKEQELK